MESLSPELFANAAALNFSVFGLFLLLLLGLSISAYVKIATVLSMLRAGLGASALPAFLITGVLSLVLSLFIMYPVMQHSLQAVSNALPQKSSLSDLERLQAIEAGAEVWKDFAIKHAHPLEKERFLKLSMRQRGQDNLSEEDKQVSERSWQILAPSFLVSELKEAFATGLSILLPLLVIDLLVSHILAAMGLMNLNAHVVSFPFKILLFVMVDGWSLITNNLLSTY